MNYLKSKRQNLKVIMVVFYDKVKILFIMILNPILSSGQAVLKSKYNIDINKLGRKNREEEVR